MAGIIAEYLLWGGKMGGMYGFVEFARQRAKYITFGVRDLLRRVQWENMGGDEVKARRTPDWLGGIALGRASTETNLAEGSGGLEGASDVGYLGEMGAVFPEIINELRTPEKLPFWKFYYPGLDEYEVAKKLLNAVNHKEDLSLPVFLPSLPDVWEKRGLVVNQDGNMADIPLGISVTPDEFGDPFSDWRLPVSEGSSSTTMVVTDDPEMQARVAHAVAYGVSAYAGKMSPDQHRLAVGGAFLCDTSVGPLIQEQLGRDKDLLMQVVRGMHTEAEARQNQNYQGSKYDQPILMLDQLQVVWERLAGTQREELVHRTGEIARLSRTAPGLHLLIACSVGCYMDMQKYQGMDKVVGNARMMLGRGMQGAPQNPLMLRDYGSNKDYWVLD